VIPWRGGNPHRERALAWLLEKLGTATVAQGPRDRPWSKGAALLPAVEASEAEIVVVHDADVWSHGTPAAVAAVEAGEPWAMPHGTVYRLSEPASVEYMAGGGFVAIPRETYLSVPMDPRFEDWGGEDLSWANALWFLTGPGWRGTADLIHLWHPPEPGSRENRTTGPNRALARRYREARADPNLMRALVNEIGGAREPV